MAIYDNYAYGLYGLEADKVDAPYRLDESRVGWFPGRGPENAYFSFDLLAASDPAESVVFEIGIEGSFGSTIGEGETITLWDVAVPVTDLEVGAGDQYQTYLDLEGGVSFGSAHLDRDSSTLVVELNQAGIDAFNDARGDWFTLGFSLEDDEEDGGFVFSEAALDVTAGPIEVQDTDLSGGTVIYGGESGEILLTGDGTFFPLYDVTFVGVDSIRTDLPDITVSTNDLDHIPLLHLDGPDHVLNVYLDAEASIGEQMDIVDVGAAAANIFYDGWKTLALYREFGAEGPADNYYFFNDIEGADEDLFNWSSVQRNYNLDGQLTQKFTTFDNGNTQLLNFNEDGELYFKRIVTESKSTHVDYEGGVITHKRVDTVQGGRIETWYDAGRLEKKVIRDISPDNDNKNFQINTIWYDPADGSKILLEKVMDDGTFISNGFAGQQTFDLFGTSEILRGGADDDIFLFWSGPGGDDVIRDFTPADGDALDMRAQGVTELSDLEALGAISQAGAHVEIDYAMLHAGSTGSLRLLNLLVEDLAVATAFVQDTAM